MKEKIKEGVKTQEISIQDNEFVQQQEGNLQLDLNKQAENLQKDAQKTESLQLSEQEQVEKKINESFPVTKDKVSTPEGDTPKEPDLVQVENKFEAIGASVDKDYENVLDTWNVYRDKYQGKNNIDEYNQLRLMEMNASRYRRWKFSLFMKSNSDKYKRFMQVKEIEKFATQRMKEVKATFSNNKNNLYEYNDIDRAAHEEMSKRHILPLRILTTITGLFHASFQLVGRKLFAVQGRSDYSKKEGTINSDEYAEIHAQFIEGLFKKKFNKDEKDKRIARDAELENQTEDEEDEVENYVSAEEQRVQLTGTYHTLLNDQKELLKLYKKGKKKNAARIAQLESQISMKTQAINDYNKDFTRKDNYMYAINTKDALKLHEELDKYRGS